MGGRQNKDCDTMHTPHLLTLSPPSHPLALHPSSHIPHSSLLSSFSLRPPFFSIPFQQQQQQPAFCHFIKMLPRHIPYIEAASPSLAGMPSPISTSRGSTSCCSKRAQTPQRPGGRDMGHHGWAPVRFYITSWMGGESSVTLVLFACDFCFALLV